MSIPDPEAVEAVLLDVGGVFVLPRPDRVRAALAEAELTAPDDLERFRQAHYRGVAAYDRSVDPPETWRAYHQGYVAGLGFTGEQLDPAIAATARAWRGPAHEHWSWRQDEAAQALARLARLGERLGIVSNADGSIARVLEEQGICQVGAGPHVAVEVIVDSGIVGIEKPDPGIFEIALDALGVPPGRALYVGDTIRNDVRGAEAAGIPCIHLDPYDLHRGEPHPRVRSLHEVADLLAGARA